MRAATVVIWSTAAAVIALLSWPVQAAPLAGAGGNALSGQTSSVEEVAYRRCWRQDGRRHCRWVEGDGRRVYGYRSYGYGVGSGRPENYAVGSTEWWRAMDRDGRGGHGRR